MLPRSGGHVTTGSGEEVRNGHRVEQTPANTVLPSGPGSGGWNHGKLDAVMVWKLDRFGSPGSPRVQVPAAGRSRRPSRRRSGGSWRTSTVPRSGASVRMERVWSEKSKARVSAGFESGGAGNRTRWTQITQVADDAHQSVRKPCIPATSRRSASPRESTPLHGSRPSRGRGGGEVGETSVRGPSPSLLRDLQQFSERELGKPLD
jgi:hypothetical protein